MIPKEDIDKVKNLDISDVITRTGVELKPAGVGALKGLCPFHGERTPSFTVRVGNGTFKCFGCQEYGDVISYISKKEGLGFVDSVKLLAEMYGINITEVSGDGDREKGPSKQRLKEVLKVSARFFENQYLKLNESHPAKKELEKRGLLATGDVFKMGYAPQGWSELTDHLLGLNFTEEEVLLAGVVKRSESGRLYDVFRGRLIWQIRDILGAVIGFGGRRIFEEESAKYLNSPQTPVYDKNRVLFGLDLARNSATKKKEIVIVEGYTDVMAYHASGIHNVVAVCGTAFTANHLTLIRRLIGEEGSIIFSLDGDKAGVAAALKVFDTLGGDHLSSYVATSDEGDPDDIRKKYGDEGLVFLLENKKRITDFVVGTIAQEYSLDTPEEKLEFIRRVGPILRNVNKSLLDDYLRKISLWTGVDVVHIRNAMGGETQNYRAADNLPVAAVNQDTTIIKKEKAVLGLLVQHPLLFLEDVTPNRKVFSSGVRPVVDYLYDILEQDVNLVSDLKFSGHPLEREIFELLYFEFPLLSKLKSRGGESTEDLKRFYRSLVKNLLDAKQKVEVRDYLGNVSRVYKDSDSSDINILEEISENLRTIRKNRS